ncbi:MAG: endolytic transglycosylase MltG, partial [Acetobacteraceae bacterium]|nr:endolytic transglycosylase MltG [Acetobacteraceae bacterium]
MPKSGLLLLGGFLTEQGVVADPNRFLLAAVATRWEGPLHAAELAFPAGASLREVLRVLRFSRPVQHLVSIPEGLTAKQIAALLARNDALSGPAAKPPEGRTLPE